MRFKAYQVVDGVLQDVVAGNEVVSVGGLVVVVVVVVVVVSVCGLCLKGGEKNKELFLSIENLQCRMDLTSPHRYLIS